MTFCHTEVRSSTWWADKGIKTINVTASDRRNAVDVLYGGWFRENGFKLTRDYMVVFGPSPEGKRSWGNGPYANTVATITIKDPKKAMLFKLTWVGV